MISISHRYWKTPGGFVASETEKSLGKELAVSPEIVHILRKRGLTTTEQLRTFLYPKLADLPDPFLMKGMKEASEIVYDALTRNRKILIWGDYDVDGITATALLVTFFEAVGIVCDWIIPNRFNDGYGLSMTRLGKELKKYKQTEPPLLITVDCGINDVREVSYAKEKGCRVIVTDHHEPGDNIVPADVILNIKQTGCEFPDKTVAGVGIAFFLAAGLRSFLRSKNFFESRETPNLKQLLEYVAIGTIADMAEVEGVNRILIKGGFEVLNRGPSVGVAALLRQSGIHYGDITSEDIGFQVAPRINAAGRVKDGSIALRLLVEKDETVAVQIAKKIDNINIQRKKLCAEYLESTLTVVANNRLEKNNCVIATTDCPLGILGIVASQLVNRISRPVILVTKTIDTEYGEVLKGSCRSVTGVDILAVLKRCEKNLLQYGGHVMAAGITLECGEFEEFKNHFESCVTNLDTTPAVYGKIDLSLPIEKGIDRTITDGMMILEPFGLGNQKPLFIDGDITVQEIRRLGVAGEHLSFSKRAKFTNQKCIAFNFGCFESDIKDKRNLSAVYTVSVSRYKKSVKWQPRIVDMI